MMKKPEEIKKGLEIAVNGCLTCDCCITDCPYNMECYPMNEDTNVDMSKQMGVQDAWRVFLRRVLGAGAW